MDEKTFDELTRTAANSTTRRGALGLLAGAALAAGIARFDLADAKKGKGKGKGKGKNKRCKKSFQDCGSKKKCCKGLTCVDGSCGCPAGTIPSGGKCINPDPAECDNDNDCDNDEICQDGECVPELEPECDNNNDCDSDEVCDDGVCVPEPPECDSDNDCDDNEECQSGTCVCPEIEDGRCIRRCEVQDDCPGVSSCRNLSPEDSPFIEDGVCVDEAFFLCDTTPCTVNNNCASDEVCVMLSCEGAVPVGRCQEISVF